MKKTLVHIPLTVDTQRKVKIETKLPILFLAGPIRNAPKWQEQAIRSILEYDRELFVASPTRYVDESLHHLLEKDDRSYEEFTRQRAPS